jgi:hypothetical protein
VDHRDAARLTQSTVLEFRYTGAHNYAGWTEYDYNEINIIENGFLNEFKLAQQNLQANIAAGRGNNFRYYGAGTGTSPLPIYLAFFSGIPASRAGDASAYTSSSFASATYYQHLAVMNPNPYTAAGTGTGSATSGLMGNATFRANAAAAGLPRNFFLANPNMIGDANLTNNNGYTDYDDFTGEVHHRMSKGLQFAASYTYGFRTIRSATPSGRIASPPGRPADSAASSRPSRGPGCTTCRSAAAGAS